MGISNAQLAASELEYHAVSVWRDFCTARALAIRLEHLLATGLVKDQAEIARTAGITRARVTQIINLTQLAPDIQEAILNLVPTTDHVPRFREREVRTIAIVPNWEKQRMLWKRLVKQTSKGKSSE